MAVKPPNLIYGLDERPPLWVTLALGLQHVSVCTITILLPVVIVREAHGTVADAERMVCMSMVAGGIGTLVQTLRRGPVGSGYLCPQICGPSFFAASLLAAKTGGLSLVFGMTAMAGVVEVFVSRIMKYLRVLFPTEVTGLIVAMVGITITRMAVSNMLGVSGEDRAIEQREVLIALATMGIMIGLNIWGKGKLKLFCVLIGMIAGYAIAYAAGLVHEAGAAAQITAKPLVAWPFSGHPGWSFNSGLIVPFLVAILCSSLKNVGDLTTCQKINDVNWRRPDMDNISKGVLADAVGCVSAGLLGGMGQSSSSSNIALSMTTGATSRVIALATGGFFILLAFFPKVAHIFVTMPPPVIGATLVFALGFMIVAGFQIVMSRMMDSRKTIVVGLSMILGLGVDMVPELVQQAPAWALPVMGNSLSTTTILAIFLNLLFRIGIAKKITVEVFPGVDSSEKIFTVMNRQGGAWGARHEVIYKAIAAMNEFLEAAAATGSADVKKPLAMAVSFDEFNLDVDIRYEGGPVPLPEKPPSRDELRTSADAAARLAGFLVRDYADKVKISTDKDGTHRVLLHFDH